ncbi:MAG TPA: hypothetical protein VM165_08695 [Planctomycetaceae bacterium]|nr:hypothetical protein [Planctomycetaceae bacterium]
MPPLLWTSLTALVLIWCLVRLALFRRAVIGTTLQPAIAWGMVANIVWLAWSVGVSVALAQTDNRWVGELTHLAYVAAVLSLCPSMLVLGARRPTNRAWTGFVIAPMIAVLCWPVITLALHGGWHRPLQLETPHLIAYLFVVVMSLGNYVGGSLTLSTLLCGAGLATIGVSSAQRASAWEDLACVMTFALMVLSVGVLAGLRRLRKATWPPEPLDRVWQEFSTLYGLVWSRRVLDRVNAIAEKQQWPGRLHADGFHWDRPLNDATQQQVEHALRWLLRRFVDPVWLDARLGHAAETGEAVSLSIDT